jgi:hypothetical protein
MNIDESLIESLLYEEESDCLDLKMEQYKFVGASDDDKSELLKDLLAFANAWRRSDAFILTGVKEIKGGRNRVEGIRETLDDAAIQQFVNSKTQRPVSFSYRNVGCENQTIGVFHIPVQQRPFYLKRDYGRLKADTVYVRRGTSTAKVDLDEISQMGRTAVALGKPPSLDVFLYDPLKRLRLAEPLRFNGLSLTLPDPIEIPDNEPERRGLSSFESIGSIMHRNTNREYSRELAEFTGINSLLTPIYFGISNDSETTAFDVQLRVTAPSGENELIVVDEYDFPSPPAFEYNSADLISLRAREAVRRFDICARRISDEWLIESNVGKIQPSAVAWIEDPVHVGSTKSQDVVFSVSAFADNLPQPHSQELHVRFVVDFQTVDLGGILELEHERKMEEDPAYRQWYDQNIGPSQDDR